MRHGLGGGNLPWVPVAIGQARQVQQLRRHTHRGGAGVALAVKLADGVNQGLALATAPARFGATLVAGGLGRPEGATKGFLVRPTIFGNVNNEMTIAREEVFGPVLTILGYTDDADAIRIANDTPYGLAGYVSGGSKERVIAVARQIRAGNINLNGVPNERTAPFGGYKQSGNGREWGKFGMEEYLEVKAIAGFA